MKIGEQSFLTAEKMDAPVTSMKNPSRRSPPATAPRRRKAHRPPLPGEKCRFISGRIDGAHLQSFSSRARIGDPVADRQSGLCRRLVERRDHRSARSIAGENERPFWINRLDGLRIARLRP